MAKSKYKLGMLVQVTTEKTAIGEIPTYYGTIAAVIQTIEGSKYRVYNGVELVGEFNESQILFAYRTVTPRATKTKKFAAKLRREKAVPLNDASLS